MPYRRVTTEARLHAGLEVPTVWVAGWGVTATSWCYGWRAREAVARAFIDVDTNGLSQEGVASSVTPRLSCACIFDLCYLPLFHLRRQEAHASYYFSTWLTLRSLNMHLLLSTTSFCHNIVQIFELHQP